MFWSLSAFSSSSIDSLLTADGGCTLTDLLEEDELLQECKTQNSKLIELCAAQRDPSLPAHPRSCPAARAAQSQAPPPWRL